MCKIFVIVSLIFSPLIFGKNVAYIHGDVAPNGTVPSSDAVPPADNTPYDQMLLTETIGTGLSQFQTLVEDQGYTISQYYDAVTTLTPAFLNQFDVVIFGLHQKIWTATEKQNLDAWLQQGGGMLIYSDSASGGLFSLVGINNPVGQNVTNNLTSDYGLQVTVDLGGGTRSYIPNSGSPNPIIWDQPELEGEGVSPVAVDTTSGAQVLIPLDPANRVGGNGNLNINSGGVTIANPTYAALALQEVGLGSIIAMFDRQPMWNGGPGSDINKKDNREILRRIIRYLARDYGNSDEWVQFKLESDTSPLEVSWRQWKGGVGAIGSAYTARNTRIQLEYSTTLENGSWMVDDSLLTLIGTPIDNQDETETVRVRLDSPTANTPKLFTRLNRVPSNTSSEVILVEAGQDRFIGENGRVALEADVSGGSGALTATWSKVSGPGTVTFNNGSAAVTTATFDQVGTYELSLSVTDGTTTTDDNLFVRVVANADVVRAVNCGNVNSGFNGSNGFNYEADTLFSNGRTDTFSGNAVSGTEDDLLYNFARSEFNNYTIPVANGTYTVYLQFAETFFTSANQRVFDLSLEGSLVLDNLDLVAETAGIWVAYDQSFTTTVTDGNLVISTTASVNNSLLNAFVIIRD